ncbi:sugar phosphate isomerase/epimerase family protein [Aestuariivirga sp. YIM B02566]|uniref:Sugar phosphate isomerase/epimerase n=1 Tax=Taklimakanibacter albus TaxID=2800327 RepID=A0ACC5R860_9HYPH|nr:sugar phosphate isomerase/epimerase [Aestuariivirga sp. YIM B02566]MBK1868701.1 sugar phosphate isomerase/epimerase [Aestuariivirga sp. YIM B02566]
MPQNGSWTLGLIDSAWFGTEYEGRRGREEAKRIGFESLDLFVGFDPGKLSKAERQAYIDENLSTGLPVVSLVCTCLGLSDFNPAIRGYHIERAKNVVDLAADMPTTRNLCFVPGEYMFQKKLIPAKGEWDAVVDATRQVGAHAATRKRELAIELLPFEFSFINSLDTMERFLDEVGLANVKATIDISHFWLMRIPPVEVAKRLKGRVAHVHMSDCDGTNHGDMPPGRGNTPFADYLAAIRETGFVGAASIELEFPPDPRGMAAWVAEAHGAALQLLKDAHVHTR